MRSCSGALYPAKPSGIFLKELMWRPAQELKGVRLGLFSLSNIFEILSLSPLNLTNPNHAYFNIALCLSRFQSHQNQLLMGGLGGNRLNWTNFKLLLFSRSFGIQLATPIELVDWVASGRSEVVSPFHKHFMARGGFQEIGSRSCVLSSTADFSSFQTSVRSSVVYPLLPAGHEAF